MREVEQKKQIVLESKTLEELNQNMALDLSEAEKPKQKTVHQPPPKAYQNPKHSIITELQSKEDE